MINIELKKIEGTNVILFKEPFTDKIKDFIILSKNEITKSLDAYSYNIIKDRCKDLFENKPFYLDALKKDLKVLYGLSIDNNKRIDYSTFKPIKDLYITLKYDELSLYLSILSKKITKEGQKTTILYILNKKISDKSYETAKQIATKLKIAIPVFVKEIKYLIMEDSIKKSNFLIKQIK